MIVQEQIDEEQKRLLETLRAYGEGGDRITDGHSTRIEGFVILENGDYKRTIRNKIVGAFAILLCNAWNTTNSQYNSIGFSAYNCYIGTDQSHGTTYNMSALNSPIGTTPGTASSSKTGVNISPSAGVYCTAMSFTWNAGTVSGTVGEIGVHGNGQNTLGSNTFTSQLLVRVSVADGEMSAFEINSTTPLTITWVIQISAP